MRSDPTEPLADVAVIVGDCANSVERSAEVILEAALHWPDIVVVDGNHEYYDTEERGCTLDTAYARWRGLLGVVRSSTSPSNPGSS